MEHGKILEYLVNNPKGKIENLKERMNEQEIKKFGLIGYLRGNLTTHYKITKSLEKTYNTIYKKSSFREKVFSLIIWPQFKLFRLGAD